MDPVQIIPTLLAIAWLLPLVSFAIIAVFGRFMRSTPKMGSGLATLAIVSAMILSLVSLGLWLSDRGSPPVSHGHPAAAPPKATGEAAHEEHAELSEHRKEDGHKEHAEPDEHGEHHAEPPFYLAGVWYQLGAFNVDELGHNLEIQISYYIDALTVCMFVMVTIIASLIHFYSMGYMAEELDEVEDHQVHVASGHYHRPGRFHRFFQYLSLFCFSMLGLVIAGNILMVFVFWELVGICSYFLIGFYFERHSAQVAANKAFIVNRVGDFGMIIGLMALWGALGTFSFGDITTAEGHVQPGIFSLVRPAMEHDESHAEEGEHAADEQAAEDHEKHHAADHALVVPLGMTRWAAQDKINEIYVQADSNEAAAAQVQEQLPKWQQEGFGYGLLVLAGIGIFCGCVGKSAQFPLQTWLPDAMEGPTPVSALVHSATMVAAGVYLAGRFFPVFAAEALLVIAYVGAITLILAATIAIVATDIKRVLAYSTISQLGYMMLAIGLGGWFAGLFHLITHAFFKSLLFMCSGSVIHACHHEQEMTKMGGLLKKMPFTGYTMLVGTLAIAGAGIPFIDLGLSGYYSKDAIIAQAMVFASENPTHNILLWAPLIGAAITSFYMFRLWFMTFLGEPRDEHVYEHAHESPKLMYVPLVVLAVFAVAVGWSLPGTESFQLSLQNLMEQARPAGGQAVGQWGWLSMVPAESLSHAHHIHVQASLAAFGTAVGGFVLAALFYWARVFSAEDAKQQFAAVHTFLVNKWYFDELYDKIFVQPVHSISAWIAGFDREAIDRFLNGVATYTVRLSKFEDGFDRKFVDGFVDELANRTYSFGSWLRNLQTGSLRQYVMFIALGTVGLFLVISYIWSFTGGP